MLIYELIYNSVYNSTLSSKQIFLLGHFEISLSFVMLINFVTILYTLPLPRLISLYITIYYRQNILMSPDEHFSTLILKFYREYLPSFTFLFDCCMGAYGSVVAKSSQQF
jgi:hypothetical protein